MVEQAAKSFFYDFSQIYAQSGEFKESALTFHQGPKWFSFKRKNDKVNVVKIDKISGDIYGQGKTKRGNIFMPKEKLDLLYWQCRMCASKWEFDYRKKQLDGLVG